MTTPPRLRSQYKAVGEGVLGKIKKRSSGDPTFPLQKKSAPDTRLDFALVHVTAVGAAREIVRSGKIEARYCKVFEIALSYFFALRPAYRRKDGHQPSDQLDRFPFVFVLNNKNLPIPYHVYPFDTGGAINEAFDAQANEFVFLEDYKLAPNYQAVSGQINWAFGSRSDYYDGKLIPNLEETLAAHESAPRSFVRIAGLATIGSNSPDQRASGIEVAFDRHVSIESHVDFAVLPRQFLEDPRGDNTDMINGLKNAGIQWEYYNWEPNRTPDEFRIEINKLVRDHLTKVGQL